MTRDRTALIAAVAFVVLLATGYAWVELPPGSDEPGRALLSWLQRNRQALPVQAWLVMLAWLPGGALLALVHRRMPGASAAAFLLGGAVFVGLLAAGVLLRLGMARHAADLDASTARLLLDMEAYWGPLATIPLSLQALSVGIATRQGAFPSWLLPITAVMALEQLAETVTIFGSDGFSAPGGPMNLFGAACFGVWVIAQGAAASGPAGPRHAAFAAVPR